DPKSLRLKILPLSPYNSEILMPTRLQLHCFHRPGGRGVGYVPIRMPGPNSGGVAGTEQALKDLGSSDCKVNGYSLADTNFTWLDKNTVLMTYKADQDATCNGQKVPGTVWASSIWVNKDKQWKAAFHQETPAQ